MFTTRNVGGQVGREQRVERGVAGVAAIPVGLGPAGLGVLDLDRAGKASAGRPRAIRAAGVMSRPWKTRILPVRTLVAQMQKAGPGLPQTLVIVEAFDDPLPAGCCRRGPRHRG